MKLWISYRSLLFHHKQRYRNMLCSPCSDLALVAQVQRGIHGLFGILVNLCFGLFVHWRHLLACLEIKGPCRRKCSSYTQLTMHKGQGASKHREKRDSRVPSISYGQQGGEHSSTMYYIYTHLASPKKLKRWRVLNQNVVLYMMPL